MKLPLFCLLSFCLLTLIIETSSPDTMSTPAPTVRWYDGTTAPAPRGALLTDNPGYWGEMVPTGVRYSYPEAPSNPADVLGADKTKFGNRLLDGQRGGNWHSPVGMNHKPLAIDFDFQQTITLGEIAVAEYREQNLKMAEIAVKTEGNEEWRKVLSLDSSTGPLHRLVLPQPVQARHVRLTLQSDAAVTYVSQVWMWGEAQPSAAAPQNGFFSEIKDFPETRDATPGDATILSPQALAQWRQQTGFSENGLVWQTAPTWQMLERSPLKNAFLPGKEALRQAVEITATQNESESAALFLVNASEEPQQIAVELEPFKDAEGRSTPSLENEVFAAGAIWTRRWGHTLRPLFSATNKPGAAQMQKYLTNGAVIKDFPTLHLPPRGTALLWINARTQNAAPGKYSAILKAGTQRIPVQLEVLPVQLPQPDVWMRFWGNVPTAIRNLWSSDDAIRREVKYQQSLGASVWQGFPVDGSYMKTAQQSAREQGRRSYFMRGISPTIRDAGYTGKLDPENLGEDLKKQVRDEVQQMVQDARAAGLSYDDWSIELWDEPTPKNMKSWAAVARLVKETDPQVQVYMNPLFWTREGTNPAGFVNDERQVQELDGWYNQLVDISVPILGQTDAEKYPEANRQFYNFLPRRVRAYFTHPNPGRMLSWDAFLRDYNGWGSYAYFAPRRDAWNDFDDREFDYQIVYPGPNGAIPTIESESMRESWDDYRLLTLLKQRGKTAELEEILKIYRNGMLQIPAEQTATDRDSRSIQAARALPRLRDRMLKSVTE